MIKGDKKKWENYRGIPIFYSKYKVFYRILLNCIVRYAEDCLGPMQLPEMHMYHIIAIIYN